MEAPDLLALATDHQCHRNVVERRLLKLHQVADLLTCVLPFEELVLLSDHLGPSILVDSIDQPKPSLATQGTVLGPFPFEQSIPNTSTI